MRSTASPLCASKIDQRSAAAAISAAPRDIHGNERGAYATSDEAKDESNGAMLTLDEADGTQVITAYANAKDGSSLSLNNERNDGVSLITWQRPSVQIREGRRVIFKQPPDAPDSH
jgi:hypothetical protein